LIGFSFESELITSAVQIGEHYSDDIFDTKSSDCDAFLPVDSDIIKTLELRAQSDTGEC
jgi:hypothetical protein